MKNIIIGIVAIVIIGAGIWYFKSPAPVNAPAPQAQTSAVIDTEQASDTTTGITADLDMINVGSSADADFSSMNQDINSL